MKRLSPLVLAMAVAAALVAAVPASAAFAGVQADPTPAATDAPITVIIPDLSATSSPSPSPSSSSGSGTGGTGSGGSTGGDDGGDDGEQSGGGTNPDGSPIAPAEPGESKPGLTLDHKSIEANDFMVASGSGYTPGEKVQLVLYPGAVVIGSVTADAAGTFTMRFRVPDSSRPGVHVAEATGWTSGYVRNKEFTVTSSVFTGGISPLWWVVVVLGTISTSLLAVFLYFRLHVARWFGGPAPQGSVS